MDKVPHRSVVDLQSAFTKFGDQAAQGEVGAHALKQPNAVFAYNRFWPVAPDLIGRDVAALLRVSPSSMIKWTRSGAM